MRRPIFVLIVMLATVAANAASGKPAKRLLLGERFSQAKNFFWRDKGMPLSWQKILTGAVAAGVILSLPLLSANSQPATIATQEQVTTSYLQQQTVPAQDDSHKVVRDGVSWTAKRTGAKRTGENYRVGLDYRDVEHYHTVKDTLTAADYDGVSIHYFVDGAVSFRGVADLIHPELEASVRVGTRIINVAQISGVLITRPITLPAPYRLHIMALPRLEAEYIAEPHDLMSYIPDSTKYAGDIAAGTRIGWYGPQGNDVYSDGYIQVRLKRVEIEDMWAPKSPWVVRFDNIIIDALVNWDKRPVPAVRVHLHNVVRDGISWTAKRTGENYRVGLDYGDASSVLGIDNLQLRHYLQTKSYLTAQDYEGALVRYREGEITFTARVSRAHDPSKPVVVDLGSDAEKVIDVADIQGVLLVEHTDYGRAATIKIGDLTCYGEVSLAFSNGELTILVHAIRQSDAELEMLTEKQTITMHREDEGLILP